MPYVEERMMRSRLQSSGAIYDSRYLGPAANFFAASRRNVPRQGRLLSSVVCFTHAVPLV